MDRKRYTSRGELKLTEAELAEIEKLGGLFMEPSEIAIILEVDDLKFFRLIYDPKHEAYKKYWKGFLLSKIKVRESEVALAQKDSSPAQTLVNGIIENLERKLKHDEQAA